MEIYLIYMKKLFSTIAQAKKLGSHQLNDKQGVVFTIIDKPGELLKVLQILNEYSINLSYISSKPSLQFSKESGKKIDVFIDIENHDEEKISKAIKRIEELNKTIKLNSLANIPWFPKTLLDLNKIGNKIKIGGESLQSDHPGFNDQSYKKRRTEIESKSTEFFFSNNNIEYVYYTEEENSLWANMWDRLIPLQRKYACDEFNENLEKFINANVVCRNKIPQLRDINDYFKNTTGMFFRPTGGLLSEREFLNTLAFRVFPSTQYIRHKSKPLYTPEPDIVHEILGHCAMFSDEEFTNFSQEIGLASLGASDSEIAKLATIYWYTIEFGLCKQNDKVKIYGGGILSSPSEIQHSVSDNCKHLDFDLNKMAEFPVDICNIQTSYFLAPSFKDMVEKVRDYSLKVPKQFNISYHIDNKSVEVDRKILI